MTVELITKRLRLFWKSVGFPPPPKKKPGFICQKQKSLQKKMNSPMKIFLCWLIFFLWVFEHLLYTLRTAAELRGESEWKSQALPVAHSHICGQFKCRLNLENSCFSSCSRHFSVCVYIVCKFLITNFLNFVIKRQSVFIENYGTLKTCSSHCLITKVTPNSHQTCRPRWV